MTAPPPVAMTAPCDRRGLAHGLGFERAEARLASRRDEGRRAARRGAPRCARRGRRTDARAAARERADRRLAAAGQPDEDDRVRHRRRSPSSARSACAHRVDRRRDAEPELQAPPRLPEEDARPSASRGPRPLARRAPAASGSGDRPGRARRGRAAGASQDRALVAARADGRRVDEQVGASRGRPRGSRCVPSERRSIVTLPAAVSRSASSTARPAPPAPRTTACCTPVGAESCGSPRRSRAGRCCDRPAGRPSRTTTLTAPVRSASADSSSTSAATAALWGMVTLAPPASVVAQALDGGGHPVGCHVLDDVAMRQAERGEGGGHHRGRRRVARCPARAAGTSGRRRPSRPQASAPGTGVASAAASSGSALERRPVDGRDPRSPRGPRERAPAPADGGPHVAHRVAAEGRPAARPRGRARPSPRPRPPRAAGSPRRCARCGRAAPRPVARSTESSGLRSVATGLTAARTTIGAPLLMPPSMPPARFVLRSQPGASGSTSSWTSLPRRTTTPKPRPISTPLTAWMPMTAAASAESRRVSHSAFEPMPIGHRPRRRRRTSRRSSRPPRWRRRPRRSSRASATGSGQRSGVGAATVLLRTSRPGSRGRPARPSPGNARIGPELVDEAPDASRRSRASSWRHTAPAATRGAVERAEARSSTSRMSSVSYLIAPARSAWPGRASVIGFGRSGDRDAARPTSAPASSASRGWRSRRRGESRACGRSAARRSTSPGPARCASAGRCRSRAGGGPGRVRPPRSRRAGPPAARRGCR